LLSDPVWWQIVTLLPSADEDGEFKSATLPVNSNPSTSDNAINDSCPHLFCLSIFANMGFSFYYMRLTCKTRPF
jgi:hypothetical protein